MMVSKFTRAAFLAALLGSVTVLTPSFAAAQAGAAKPADPVVARVNGREVKQSEVINAIRQLGPQAQQVPPQQLFPAMQEQVVNGKLVADAGYKQKLQDSPEAKEMLKRAEEEIVEQVYLSKQIETKFTPDTLKRAYAEFVKNNPPQEEVRARHILVKTKAEAEALIKQVKGGADFVKLASEQKIDTAAAGQGGDLGYFVASEMVEPFSKAAFAMKAGDVSNAPVETSFGWHVIKVEDKRPRPVPTQEQAEPQLRSEIAQQAVKDIVADLRRTAKIELYQPDGSPIPAGGAAVGGQGQRPSAPPAPAKQ